MSEVSHNYDESLRFLRLLYPEGPWMITAISVDKKKIRTKTFLEDEFGKIVSWLETHSSFNLYYSVNRPVVSAYEKSKLLKSEVAAGHYLHVDVDPREGEDLASEQSRIAKVVADYKIKPTFVVFSGGGYNALWRLDKPFLVADTPGVSEPGAVALAEEFERRNWQFELDFDTPDHCRDIGRILRLPGTVNWPDAKKKARGRVVSLAKLANYEDVSYPFSRFASVTPPSTNASMTSSRSAISPSNMRRIESLDELKISEKLKVIIAQGFDPEKHSSLSQSDRSNYLFNACCEMIRLGIPDPTILGIITDSRFGISASVLDKGSQVTRYAVRQLERAHDNHSGEPIGEMNDKFAVILSYGSKTMIMVEDGYWNDRAKRHEPVFQNFSNFKARVKNLPAIEIPSVNGKKSKKIDRFTWWTSHKHRREYESVCFEPGLETPGRYNLWTGFSVQPHPGDRHERLLEHVFENICDSDQECYDYLVKWMARVVQQPRTCSMVSPVLLSPEKGVGKSVFTKFFGEIFEPHACVVSDVVGLTGKFNAHIGTSLFVVAEEAFQMRDRRYESVLKELITGSTIGIERKGIDRIEMANYTHILMTSNNTRVIPAGDHERRFFVLRVNPRKLQDSGYFLRIIDDQKRGGVSHLLHHLMNVDLSSFDVTVYPKTSALQEQQEHNLMPELEWLLDALHSGTWGENHSVGGPVSAKFLLSEYRQFMIDRGKQRMIMGRRAFVNFLDKEFPGLEDDVNEPDRKIFPPLDWCRKQFVENRGWIHDITRWRDVPQSDKVGDTEPITGQKDPF